MTDQEIAETLRALGQKTIRLDAKCQALSICLVDLAKRQGIPEQQMIQMVQIHYETVYQKLLEAIEDVDPKSAANLDSRPNPDGS